MKSSKNKNEITGSGTLFEGTVISVDKDETDILVHVPNAVSAPYPLSTGDRYSRGIFFISYRKLFGLRRYAIESFFNSLPRLIRSTEIEIEGMLNSYLHASQKPDDNFIGSMQVGKNNYDIFVSNLQEKNATKSDVYLGDEVHEISRTADEYETIWTTAEDGPKNHMQCRTYYGTVEGTEHTFELTLIKKT